MRRTDRWLRTRLTARRLRRDGDPVVAALGEALSYRPAADEREWIARIESERERLTRSDEILRTPLYDYSLDPAHEYVFEDSLAKLATRGSKPPDAALFLFALVRLLRPDRVIELGTNLGLSAGYLGAALRLNESGSLVTIDASRERMRVARDTIARLGLDPIVDARLGRFQAALPDVVQEPFGVAFIDGHHQEKETLEEIEMMLPAIGAPGVIVYDDIDWSDGMRRAWSRLKADARVRASAEFLDMGVCVYALPRER